jgi:hypothetical protein
MTRWSVQKKNITSAAPPTANRQPPTANRQPPTANRRTLPVERQTPNAKRQAPNAKRQAGAGTGWSFGKGLKVKAIRKAPRPMPQEPT